MMHFFRERMFAAFMYVIQYKLSEIKQKKSMIELLHIAFPIIILLAIKILY